MDLFKAKKLEIFSYFIAPLSAATDKNIFSVFIKQLGQLCNLSHRNKRDAWDVEFQIFFMFTYINNKCLIVGILKDLIKLISINMRNSINNFTHSDNLFSIRYFFSQRVVCFSI
ncbi:hypothetical protein D3C74_325900 [compost metagenome]